MYEQMHNRFIYSLQDLYSHLSIDVSLKISPIKTETAPIYFYEEVFPKLNEDASLLMDGDGLVSEEGTPPLRLEAPCRH